MVVFFFGGGGGGLGVGVGRLYIIFQIHWGVEIKYDWDSLVSGYTT